MKKHYQAVLWTALTLGVATSAFAQQSMVQGAQKTLSGIFSGAKEDELIEPELAFKMNASAKGSQVVVAELMPAKGYYLYRDKIRFSLKDSNGVTLGAVKLPAGEIKNDQLFGKTEVYRKPVIAEIALNRTPKAKNVTLVATYQGCHEKLGVCYPPIEKVVSLALP